MSLRRRSAAAVAAAAAAAMTLLVSGCGSGSSGDSVTGESTGSATATSTGTTSTLPEPTSQEEVRPGVSAADCDDPEAALTQAEWTEFCAPPTEGSVTVPEEAAIVYPDGLRLEIASLRTEPDDLDDGLPNENDDYDTAAYLTLRLTNTGAMTLPLPDGSAFMTANLLFGVNRYDAAGWAHSGGDLPAQLVPGTSAETELLYSLPSAELGTLAFTVNPDAGQYTDYTFTDVQTLIGRPPTRPTPAGPTDECIGYGCSPEQDAELNESEREANPD